MYWLLCDQGRNIMDIDHPVGPFGTKVSMNYCSLEEILFLFVASF